MSQKRRTPSFKTELFRRSNSAGEALFYVRFLDEDGQAVATRSTGKTKKPDAIAEAARIYASLDLSGIAAAKEARREETDDGDAEKRAEPFTAFILRFWSDGDYITDRIKAGRPLSSKYVETCAMYAKKHVSAWPDFARVTIGTVQFKHVDAFARWLGNSGASRYIVDRTLDALKKPISWAAARGLCSPVDFSGLTLNAYVKRERGLLTVKEIQAILALPTEKPWKADAGAWHVDVRPRPRLPGGVKNQTANRVDPRMKAFVLLGLFAGLRRGEERGLRWGSVDLEHGRLTVNRNYQDKDGMKPPKADSIGELPIAPELIPILSELHSIAELIGRDGLGDYVLLNSRSPEKPISATTCRRGWERILNLIGIDEAERKRRHLVPHGTRHAFATRLLDGGLTPSETAKLTRHRSTKMVLERYGAHLTAETLARATAALAIPEEAKI